MTRLLPPGASLDVDAPGLLGIKDPWGGCVVDIAHRRAWFVALGQAWARFYQYGVARPEGARR